MAFVFSERSKQRMNGIHPDLQAVMALALERSPIDFTILEGLRSLERQKQLVAKGASKTMNSRHLSGHAVDIAPLDDSGDVSWDWPLYHVLAPVVKQAAKDLGVDIEWGGDWRTFKDGPHWQLSWNTYAADDMTPRANLQKRLVSTAPDNIFGEDDFDWVPPKLAQSIVTPRIEVAEPPSEGRTKINESTTIKAQQRQWAGAVVGFVPGIWAAFQAQDVRVQMALVGAIGVSAAIVFWTGRHIISERLDKWMKGVR